MKEEGGVDRYMFALIMTLIIKIIIIPFQESVGEFSLTGRRGRSVSKGGHSCCCRLAEIEVK